MKRSTRDREMLTDDEMEFLRVLKCPDCESEVREGPHGGLSINVYCSSESCGSRFNVMGPFGVERITDARPQREKPPSKK